MTAAGASQVAANPNTAVKVRIGVNAITENDFIMLDLSSYGMTATFHKRNSLSFNTDREAHLYENHLFAATAR
jgi:hypothetical protein